jgi:nickel transport protein
MILSLLIATPADAHKASVFAAVRGKTISGEAYFRDGAPVRNARVTVLDAGGGKLGETQTDAAGRFTFEPSRRCDLRVVVDAGDGHAAEYTVRADELPADLADGGQGAAPAGESAPATSSFAAAKDRPGKQNAQPSDSLQDVRGELEAIQAQIVQLRRDLAAREDRARWSDVLGGIGYILGLMGLAFYFLGVRRKGIRDRR